MMISTISSARCIRAWPLLQRGDESHLQACVLSTATPASTECAAPVLQTIVECRTRGGATAAGDGLVPNPAACERRCKRPRG